MVTTCFKRLRTAILAFIVYHNQIDDFSKRTNQIIEIIIRFIITNYSNINFVLILSSLQTTLNNFVNVTIDLALNEIIYDFKIRKTLTTLFVDQVVDLSTQRLKYRQKAVDAIAFANVKVKVYYDARHTPLLLKVEDYAYLRLHHEYRLFSKLERKISQQRCESFLIKRRVKRLIYELKLLSAWRIYSIVSITQLKSTSKSAKSNSYNRSRSTHFLVIEMKENISQYQFYEIKKLMNRRIRKYDKTSITQYLMRWLDYESKYDEWRSLSALKNNMKLIEQYEINHSVEIEFENRRRRRRNEKTWEWMIWTDYYNEYY